MSQSITTQRPLTVQSITLRNTTDLSVASRFTKTDLLPLESLAAWKAALALDANDTLDGGEF